MKIFLKDNLLRGPLQVKVFPSQLPHLPPMLVERKCNDVRYIVRRSPPHLLACHPPDYRLEMVVEELSIPLSIFFSIVYCNLTKGIFMVNDNNDNDVKI